MNRIVLLFTVVAVILGLGITQGKSIENFIAPRSVKVIQQVSWAKPSQLKSLNAGLLGNDTVYYNSSNLQAPVPPRFLNAGVGTQLKYSLPSIENQGVPTNPLTFGRLATSSEIGNNKCGNQKVVENFDDSVKIVTNMADMNSSYGMEDMVQPVIYERLILANKKSRLHGLGDPIRGDIPIVPQRNGWFTPSVAPHIDLRAGAMNIISGNNETGNQLQALMAASASM